MPTHHSSDFVGPGFSEGSSSQQKDTSGPATLSDAPAKSRWQGIHVATARSDQTSYYGPLSSFYFISHIGSYLSKALKRPLTGRTLQPRGANSVMHLGYSKKDESHGIYPTSVGIVPDNGPLSRTQEEYILKLFWESYHCLMPIVDETEFGYHYASLWESSSGQDRNQSPLVDMILALCLQYGYAFIPREAMGHFSNDGDQIGPATVAGHWYYRRAQSLLIADLESPTIATVQCYILATAYLCSASFQNMCHIVVAQAIRTAHILGLHLDPPKDMPRNQREQRRRIWWVLWSQDVKTSLKHGRPLMIDRGTTSTTLPSDDLEIASFNKSSLVSGPQGISWLTYNTQLQRMYLAMVDIHDALLSQAGESIDQKGLSSIYTDSGALELCATVLAQRLPALTDWAEQLPIELKMQRRGDSGPYSTDRSPLKLDPLDPNWLQTQRISLELTYHIMILNLTRPFITFHSNPGFYTPMAERLATICVNHAISYTLIMHQVITETELMSGWTDFFSLQWNAAITIIGFIIASPIHSATRKAREAIDKAIAIFDVFGRTFAVSADAAAIARDIMSKADTLARNLSTSITASNEEQNDTAVTTATANGSAQILDAADSGLAEFDSCWPIDPVGNGLAWLDSARQIDPLYSSDFADWVQYVDLFNT